MTHFFVRVWDMERDLPGHRAPGPPPSLPEGQSRGPAVSLRGGPFAERSGFVAASRHVARDNILQTWTWFATVRRFMRPAGPRWHRSARRRARHRRDPHSSVGMPAGSAPCRENLFQWLQHLRMGIMLQHQLVWCQRNAMQHLDKEDLLELDFSTIETAIFEAG